ncbi:hypothetical protein D7Z26_22585 [Cohnella endophytica]|uniref:Copper amine oxidase-like N-terminal domain-containing protein n=1 Tax=Cohnella endophytica TaxID=2419778 RepID=A0A494XIT6_9BACL|nr:hypothetical protein [Cohnella endophytica]RKP47994.1 hypothetical protein D7Z26_22585 [Cohnella endophytica]
MIETTALRIKSLTVALLGTMVISLLMLGSSSAATLPVTFPIASMDIGEGHALLAYKDGTVAAWGWNKYGQLGNGNNYEQYIPEPIANLAGVKQVAAGNRCSMALLRDGTVWRSGRSCPGNETTSSADSFNTFTQLTSLQNVKQIALGNRTAAVLLEDGTVWSWGNDLLRGQEQGLFKDPSVPVQVPDLTDVVTIEAGAYHVLALKKDGTVWSWGQNDYGEIGNGSKEQQFVPQQVKGLTEVKAIAADRYQSAALQADGTVMRWGKIIGSISLKPVSVKGLDHIAALKLGTTQLIAIRSDGTVWQSGGESAYSSKPGKIPGLSNIVQISAGDNKALALAKDGTLYAWGNSALPSAGTYMNGNLDTKPRVVPEPIGFAVNGQTLKLVLSPGYDNGQLAVPRAGLWEKIGVQVKLSYSKPDALQHNAVYNIWTFSRGDKSVVFVQSSKEPTATVNGKVVKDAPRLLTTSGTFSSTTMVPFDFVCKALDIAYRWDAATRTYSFDS